MTVTLVEVAPGHQLATAAAASYLRARAAGAPSGITSAYRSPARQAEMRAAYLAARARGERPTFVARVEDSEHVTGRALDIPASPQVWFRAHGAAHGWVFTDPTERWHVAYRPALDQHAHDTTTPAPAEAPQMEDDDMPWFFRRKDGAVAMVTPTGVRPVTLEAWQVWSNLGHTSRYDNLDDGPFGVMVQSLGGWVA